MNIRTILLDDDDNSRLAAEMALTKIPDVEVAGSFSTSSQLTDFLAEHTAHLLLLDIELDNETGFSIARMLRKEQPEIMVAFLTGHSSYAIDGYDFHPVNFLTKPINPRKLAETIAEVRRRLEHRRNQHPAKLMFRMRQGYSVFDVRDICYVERRNRKCYLRTETEEIQIGRYTMPELEEMFCEHDFFLCHQSFLISLYRIQSLRDVGQRVYEARLRGTDAAVPVARGRYKALIDTLHDLGINIF